MVKRELPLREHQLLMLDILKDVHCFCVNNGIHYSLEGGSLIGAIRHKGFIPWDDDIDIILTRDQYELFCAKYKSDRYEIVTVDNDPSYLLPYARVCDKKHSTYDALLPCSKEPTGIWIDILIADGIPSCKEAQESFYNMCRKMRLVLYNKVRGSLMSFKFSHFFKKETLLFNLKLLFKKLLFCTDSLRQGYVRKMIRYNIKFKDQDTSFWTTACCPTSRQLISRPWADFEDYLLCDFEDSQFYVMKGYDGYLKNQYGDYMQYPPVADRVPQLKDWYHFYVLE